METLIVIDIYVCMSFLRAFETYMGKSSRKNKEYSVCVCVTVMMIQCQDAINVEAVWKGLSLSFFFCFFLLR